MGWTRKRSNGLRLFFGAVAGLFQIFWLTAMLGVISPGPAFAATHHRNILVLLSSQPELPASQAVVKGLESVLKTDPDIHVYYEFLDGMRFHTAEHFEQSERFLRTKYALTRFDVAVAIGPEALHFLLTRGAGLIVPSRIVFGSISEANASRLPPNSGASGIVSRFDLVKTLALARALQPDLRHVAVIAGASPFDRSWEARAREQLAGKDDGYQLTYLTGLPMPDLLDRVARLPEASAILFLSVFKDGEGHPYVSREVVEQVSQAANAPVYSVYDTYLDHGIVGGYMDTFEAVGRQVGALALRKSSGEAAQQPDIQPSQTHGFIVDWRALQRWGLAKSRLPSGTEIRSKPPSLWQRETIALILAVLIGLSALVLKFYREIRNRRRAEQEATDSRDQIELSVSAANLGLWEWDPVTDKVWTSDHCRKLLGLDGGETVAREKFLDCLQGEDRTLAVARMLKAMATGNPCEAEYSLVQADGTVRWLSSRASRRSRGGGRRDYLLGVLMDITERKLAEHETVEQRKQLTHLTRVSVLGALSGALAHELNQPLTAILSNAQAAKRILMRKPYDLREIRKILEDIVEDDRRAGDVIHHLRALLRREETTRTPIDINQLVASVLDFARSDLLLKGVNLTRKLARDCPLIEGDAIQLQQVLLNLIVNACDAMSRKPSAGRSLCVKTEVTKKNKLRVSVVDTGEGISEDDLAKLFEPFHTTKALGLGLGLPICNWIIGAHGGKLSAHNNDDGGATFSFDLPLPVEVTHATQEPYSVSG